MSRRPTIVSAVLAAFVATTAVPGPGVVVHRHGGGDHDHVHAFPAVDHDDHDHHHHDHHHVARHHGRHAHLPRFARDHQDPLAHAHVVAPFQPATASAPLTLASSLAVTVPPPSTPQSPPAHGPESIRSRGPPAPTRS